MPALQCTMVNYLITSFQIYKNKSILMPTLPKSALQLNKLIQK